MRVGAISLTNSVYTAPSPGNRTDPITIPVSVTLSYGTGSSSYSDTWDGEVTFTVENLSGNQAVTDVAAVVENAVAEGSDTAWGANKPSGSFEVNGDKIEVSYKDFSEFAQVDDGKISGGLVTDLPYFLAALHEGGINTISYGGETFTWDSSLKPNSKWSNNNGTLVAAITADWANQLDVEMGDDGNYKWADAADQLTNGLTLTAPLTIDGVNYTYTLSVPAYTLNP